MRGPSHKHTIPDQNRVCSTIQWEQTQNNRKLRTTPHNVIHPYELQTENQLSWITLSGTPLKATERGLKRRIEMK